jgi:hypothetical protein
MDKVIYIVILVSILLAGEVALPPREALAVTEVSIGR